MNGCNSSRDYRMPQKTITRRRRRTREDIRKMQTLLADILCEHKDEIPEHVFDKLVDIYVS